MRRESLAEEIACCFRELDLLWARRNALPYFGNELDSLGNRQIENVGNGDFHISKLAQRFSSIHKPSPIRDASPRRPQHPLC
jgi:hypothetical protein